MRYLEYFRAAEKVSEWWGVKCQLIEEFYENYVDERSIDSGHGILQVLAVAFEVKLRESGEDNAYERRRTSAFSVGTGSRGS